MARIIPIEAIAGHCGLSAEDVLVLARAHGLRLWTFRERRFLDPREIAAVRAVNRRRIVRAADDDPAALTPRPK